MTIVDKIIILIQTMMIEIINQDIEITIMKTIITIILNEIANKIIILIIVIEVITLKTIKLEAITQDRGTFLKIFFINQIL